jgi:hypothetical protein
LVDKKIEPRGHGNKTAEELGSYSIRHQLSGDRSLINDVFRVKEVGAANGRNNSEFGKKNI